VSREKISPAEKLLHFISVQLNFCDQNHDFFRIFTSAQFDLDPREKAKMGQQHMEKMKEFVIQVGKMVAGCGPGLVTKDTEFLGTLLLGLIQATMMQWLLSGQPGKIEKKSELLHRIFMQGILKTR
jgi:hypothetical protein